MPLRVLTTESKITDGAEARRWIEQNVPRGCTKVHDRPLFWLDIIEPDPAAIDWLASYFHFHPLTIEDLRSPNERGKIEIYDGYVFIIAHGVFVEAGDMLGGPHHAADQHAGHAGTPASRRGPQVTAKSAPPEDLICNVDSYELHSYLSRNYLITVRDAGLKLVDRIWNEVDKHQEDE
jgi:Mg2+ and Co2+ transporter CorA